MANPTSKLDLVVNGVTTTYDIHDANAVDLTNNQTVGGIKTFSDAPVVSAITLDGKTIDTDANDNMTFDSHIVDTIEEQGNGYIRYSNGIQICFSGTTALNSEIEKQITFPKPFSLNPAVLVCGQSSYLYMNGWTSTRFIARVDGGATIYFSWIAIGIWK